MCLYFPRYFYCILADLKNNEKLQKWHFWSQTLLVFMSYYVFQTSLMSVVPWDWRTTAADMIYSEKCTFRSVPHTVLSNECRRIEIKQTFFLTHWLSLYGWLGLHVCNGMRLSKLNHFLTVSQVCTKLHCPSLLTSINEGRI